MDIQPEGEQIRKAIRWVSAMREENPKATLFALLQEAAMKFDLSPKDQEFLTHFFTEKS
ncbi:MAG: hypothetical protein M0Z75_16285 [Nitrospiraceae bacterium]|nr:hypothetical protein [Nitrospiraceae bacterium]